MKKFMIITPRNISPKGTIPRIHAPLGALAIASQAKHDGFVVELLDTSIGEIDEYNKCTYFDRVTHIEEYDNIEFWKTGLSDEQIVERIRQFNPDVIGLSCCTVVDREDTKYLCKLINDVFPQIPLILGGHEVSHNYEDILINRVERNYIPNVAGISLGLGQQNISSILNYVISNDKEKTPYPKGYASLIDGVIKVYESEYMDPNEFALFDYSLLKKVYVSNRQKPYDVYSFIGNTHAGNISELLGSTQKPLSYFPLFTSYGCGNNCTFCDTDQFLLRYSVENVIKMIQQFDEIFGIDYIDCMDNNFAGGNEQSRKTCFGILDYIANKRYKIGFSNGLTFESMIRDDFELLKIFQKHNNVAHIAFPCENGNDRVLNMIRKPHNISIVLKTLDYVKKHLNNVNREGFFIGGFPETLGKPAETPEEVNNTVKFIQYVIQNDLLDQAIFLKLSPVTSMYRTIWEKTHPDKSFVHCLFSKGTNIWPYDNNLLEEARLKVMKINENAKRFVTRKL